MGMRYGDETELQGILTFNFSRDQKIFEIDARFINLFHC